MRVEMRGQRKHPHALGVLAIIMALLVASALWFLVGCASSVREVSSTGPVGVSDTLIDQGPPFLGPYYARWGQPVVVDGLMQVVVESPRVDPLAQPVDALASAADSVVVYCMVTIRNIGDDVLAYDQSDFFMTAGEVGGWAGDQGVTTSIAPALESGTLVPGDEVRAALPYQLHRALLPEIAMVEYLYWSRACATNIEWR